VGNVPHKMNTQVDRTTVLMAQIKSTEQTPATTPDPKLLVSLTPEAIPWQPIFDGAEFAVLSGDPNKAGSAYVIRVKHRNGLKVPPHWHWFDEPITVISGTWVMGTGERYDLSATQEFPAGSYIVVARKVHHFAVCKGETIVQGHGIGPLDTIFVRPEDDPRKMTK
jgi:quercetin dioxygenase-like cupin family protein